MTDSEQRLAAALAEYLDRRARGESIDADAFCRGFPEIESGLRAGIETLAGIDALLDEPDEPDEPAAPEEPLPATLSGHHVLCQIGSGGMGRVLLALDPRLNRRVAIKTLQPRYCQDKSLAQRFIQEARAMARLSHPNIARIYDLGPPDEEPHFVMEYVEGAPLTQAADALPLRQRIELLEKAARAVDFLHRNGLVHRDLKPANILVTAELEPKLLDFGLALAAGDPRRLSDSGAVVGTPDYLSPEQAAASPAIGARSDVFSLGVILYELLTGAVPFHGGAPAEQLRAVREQDPTLPRRRNPDVPGALQSVCLQALEKEPAHRYPSAREFAADLERWLAGEPVLAAPRALSRLVSERRTAHLTDIEGWRRDRVVNQSEYDSLRRAYDRLVERDDAWILESRRLSLPQVSLYFGAWLLVAAAALTTLTGHSGLDGWPAILAAAAATAPAAWAGARLWRTGELRIGLAWLLAFCLLLPLFLLLSFRELGWAAQAVAKREFLESVTNAQMWWALALSLPAYLWLRRFTRSSVFSLAFATGAALLHAVTMLRMGLLEWIEKDPGKPYFWLLPAAAAFFAAGFWLERQRRPEDSRHFYPFATVFTLAAWSGAALFHEPWRKWLEAAAPFTRGQAEYLFLINAAIYTALQALCERFPSAQLRVVAKAFRLVLPGHVLTSLLLLGMAASGKPELRDEARAFQLLLPAAAVAFVFGSIPKQMKNFFVTGLLFFAIGVFRLADDLLRQRAWWPLALLTAGLSLMAAASRYSALRSAARRFFSR